MPSSTSSIWCRPMSRLSTTERWTGEDGKRTEEGDCYHITRRFTGVAKENTNDCDKFKVAFRKVPSHKLQMRGTDSSKLLPTTDSLRFRTRKMS